MPELCGFLEIIFYVEFLVIYFSYNLQINYLWIIKYHVSTKDILTYILL